MLGIFGKFLQERLSQSMRSIYGNYILVLDNFAVDMRGQKGIIDPRKDMKEAGYTLEEIERYLNEENSNREIEKKARADFARLILDLSNANPEINIIFRPHPVLDTRYWQEVFCMSKNISVVEKGAIHAWIYGSIATIHSGCTTGLEAYGANKHTFDISNLINQRIAGVEKSLISKTQTKIESREEFFKSIKELCRSISKNINVVLNSKPTAESTSTQIEENLSKALSLMQRNCQDVSSNIKRRIDVINGDDVIGSSSSISYIIEKMWQLNGKNFISIDKLIEANCTINMMPNSGKSRYVEIMEINARIKDIEYAFRNLGVSLPSPKIQKISTNLFRLSGNHRGI